LTALQYLDRSNYKIISSITELNVVLKLFILHSFFLLYSVETACFLISILINVEIKTQHCFALLDQKYMTKILPCLTKNIWQKLN